MESVKEYKAKLDEELTCSICLERYTSPKVLPCQHTFCKEPCMRQLITDNRRKIKCPECRQIHSLPPEGIEGFKNNFSIQRSQTSGKQTFL